MRTCAHLIVCRVLENEGIQPNKRSVLAQILVGQAASFSRTVVLCARWWSSARTVRRYGSVCAAFLGQSYFYTTEYQSNKAEAPISPPTFIPFIYKLHLLSFSNTKSPVLPCARCWGPGGWLWCGGAVISFYVGVVIESNGEWGIGVVQRHGCLAAIRRHAYAYPSYQLQSARALNRPALNEARVVDGMIASHALFTSFAKFLETI